MQRAAHRLLLHAVLGSSAGVHSHALYASQCTTRLAVMMGCPGCMLPGQNIRLCTWSSQIYMELTAVGLVLHTRPAGENGADGFHFAEQGANLMAALQAAFEAPEFRQVGGEQSGSHVLADVRVAQVLWEDGTCRGTQGVRRRVYWHAWVDSQHSAY